MIWLFLFLITLNTTIFCGTKLQRKEANRIQSAAYMRLLRKAIKQDPERAAIKKAREAGLKKAKRLLENGKIDSEMYWKLIASLPVISLNKDTDIRKRNELFKKIPSNIDTSGIPLVPNQDDILVPERLLNHRSLPSNPTRSESPLSMISDSGYQEED